MHGTSEGPRLFPQTGAEGLPSEAYCRGMEPSLRLIQVGLGGWGRDWARTLRRVPELIDTVAYADSVPAMLELAQTQAGVPERLCFPSLTAALDAVDADAVLVTTPLTAHLDVALEALQAGKHVLVEKPFGPSVAESIPVVEAAEAAGLVLAVSQNYRFYAGSQAAAEVVRSGELGPVTRVGLQFRKWANDAAPEGHLHYGLRHPLLLDMAIHHFDLMRFVLGQEPVRATCVAWNPPWSRFAEPAAASATIRFSEGTVVDYQGSWVSTGAPTLWAGAWSMECEGGVIEWTARDDLSDATNDRLIIRPRKGRPRTVRLDAPRYPDRLGSMAEFVRAVRAGDAPSVSARENLGSLALTFGVIRAADTGEPVLFG